jgi:hypothetical protein
MVFSSKQTNLIASLAFLSVSALFGQTNAPAAGAAPQDPPAKPTIRTASSSSSSAILDKTTYIRRVTFGATLTVMGLDTFANNSASNVGTAIDALYDTTVKVQRLGYGVTGQLAITNHISVASGFYLRKTGYTMHSDIYTGVPPLSLIDDRKHTVADETTNARFYDIPLTARFFFKGRQVKGPHAYVEGGGVYRKVSNIRSSTDTSIGSAASTNSTTPIKPFKQNVTGMVAGFGIHLVDPIGLRVIPSVRYTRFLDSNFNMFSTIQKKNQIEAMITIGF